MLIICKDLQNRYNVYHNFSFFTVFLKNRNIISKIKRSKVTDHAALKLVGLRSAVVTIPGHTNLLFKTICHMYNSFVRIRTLLALILINLPLFW